MKKLILTLSLGLCCSMAFANEYCPAPSLVDTVTLNPTLGTCGLINNVWQCDIVPNEALTKSTTTNSFAFTGADLQPSYGGMNMISCFYTDQNTQKQVRLTAIYNLSENETMSTCGKSDWNIQSPYPVCPASGDFSTPMDRHDCGYAVPPETCNR